MHTKNLKMFESILQAKWRKNKIDTLIWFISIFFVILFLKTIDRIFR